MRRISILKLTLMLLLRNWVLGFAELGHRRAIDLRYVEPKGSGIHNVFKLGTLLTVFFESLMKNAKA